MEAFLLAWLLLVPAVRAEIRPVQASADYIVGAHDVLNVTVFGEPEISRRYPVESDGTFEFPWVGRVTAGGLTSRAIQDQLVARLKHDFLLNPQVSVEVVEFRSQVVFVAGEVRTPGTYPLKGSLSVLQALVLAGFSTPEASNEVLVVRPRTADGASRPAAVDDRTAEIIRVNIKDLESGRLSQDIQLRDRDSVFVPKAETFFVTGHVRNPGSYVLERGLTVLQAISLAGGPSERGSDRGINILRIADGKQHQLAVKLTDIVQAGDTVVVRQRFF